MKILVYGGTGSQGSAVVWAALARGHETYVLTRHAEKAAEMRAKGAKIAIGDLTDAESLRAASEGMDAVSLMLPFSLPNPAEGVTYIKSALDAAQAAGVKMVVFNTSGPVITERIGNPIYDMRHDLIDAVKASGIPYIIIQPTVYMENLLGPWTRQGIVENDTLGYPVEENTPLGWIATADVGALMVTALERPELAGSHFTISGEENLKGSELAARFSEALGREIRYYAQTPEEFGELLESAMGVPGIAEGAAAGYRFQRDNAHLLPMWTDMKPVLEKLPVQMTSVVDWAKQFAPLFTRQTETQRS